MPHKNQNPTGKLFWLSQPNMEALRETCHLAHETRAIPPSQYACRKTQVLLVQVRNQYDEIKQCLQEKDPRALNLFHKLKQTHEDARQCMAFEAKYRHLIDSLQQLFRSYYASMYLDRRARDFEGGAWRAGPVNGHWDTVYALDLSTGPAGFAHDDYATVGELVRAFDEELAKRGLSRDDCSPETRNPTGLFDTPAGRTIEWLAMLWCETPDVLLKFMQEGTKSTEFNGYVYMDMASRGNWTFRLADDFYLFANRLHKPKDEALRTEVSRRILESVIRQIRV